MWRQNNASEPNFLSSNDRQYDFISISAIRFYFSFYWKKKSHVKMSFMPRTIRIYLHQMKGNSACTILYSQINCSHCPLLLKKYFRLGQCSQCSVNPEAGILMISVSNNRYCPQNSLSFLVATHNSRSSRTV